MFIAYTKRASLESRFTHPYFRDGRARGDAITCDAITGCGHSLNNWEFYRETHVLYGNLSVGSAVYPNPTPSSVLWRPDRLTVRYEPAPGLVLTEVKFFTDDDVLLDIITLARGPGAPPDSVTLQLEGESYVNAKAVSATDPSYAKVLD